MFCSVLALLPESNCCRLGAPVRFCSLAWHCSRQYRAADTEWKGVWFCPWPPLFAVHNPCYEFSVPIWLCCQNRTGSRCCAAGWASGCRITPFESAPWPPLRCHSRNITPHYLERLAFARLNTEPACSSCQRFAITRTSNRP